MISINMGKQYNNYIIGVLAGLASGVTIWILQIITPLFYNPEVPILAKFFFIIGLLFLIIGLIIYFGIKLTSPSTKIPMDLKWMLFIGGLYTIIGILIDILF